MDAGASPGGAPARAAEAVLARQQELHSPEPMGFGGWLGFLMGAGLVLFILWLVFADTMTY